MARTVFYNESTQAMSFLTAQALMKEIIAMAAKQEHVVVGSCGGRSPVGLLKELCAVLQVTDRRVRNKLQFFFVDERVTEDPAELNETVVREHLLSELLVKGCIDADQIHSFAAINCGNPSTAKANAETYNQILQSYGGRFNVAILGVGEDGHCAALFPYHKSIQFYGLPGFLYFEDSPKEPATRMSANRRLLEETDVGVVIFSSSGKQTALEKFASGAYGVNELPVQIANQMPNLIIGTDIDCYTSKQLAGCLN